MFRRTLLAFITIVATAMAGSGIAVPAYAGADDSSGNVQRTTRHLKKTIFEGKSSARWMRFHSPNVCIRWSVQGVLQYRAGYIYRDLVNSSPTHTYYVDNVRISVPSITVRAYRPSGSTCTTRTPINWQKITVRHTARASQCDWNPSVSASFPWSVGFSFWPSCGKKRTAYIQGSIGRSSSYRINRTEAVLKFAAAQEKVYGTKKTGLRWKCLGMGVTVTVTRNNTEDQKSGRTPICFNWDGNLRGMS